jgi:nucleotide-binding universal stress UspA family protein
MAFGKQRQARQPRRVHAIGMKKLSIQNIVVPIDFSKMSIQAIKTASRLARRFAASLHLAHVRQFDYAGDFVAPAPPIVPFSFMPYKQNGERSVAKELNALAREYGVSSANCHVLRGASPFDEICQIAQQIPADLIVMPTHGYTGLKHVFLGSTAERIIQHSPCPVFVMREKKRRSKTGPLHSINTILVPVDFSDCSRKGLQYAIRFANGFGARIILLHATYLGYIYSSEGTAIYDIPALQKAARKNAQRQMRQLVRAVNFEGVKFETAFTDGSPVSDICSFAKEHDVDLIITSTHGLTGLKHALIGSVAEQVVRRAYCSVLVVPSHPQTRMAKLAKARGRAAQKVTRQGKPLKEFSARAPQSNSAQLA